MSNYIELLQNGVVGGDVTVISLIVAVIVVLITILIFVCRGGSNKRQAVLLVGLCDSGKTLLFSQLVHNRYVSTHTSVKENTGMYTLSGDKSGSLRVVDLPGHERLRTKFLEQYKTQTRGIMFVVDSMTLTKEIKEVGEYLYTLLTDKTISQNSPPILIACNKQDQTLAKGGRIIQASLEKELNTVRRTKSAALVGTDNSASNNIFLGRKDKDFSFSDLKPLKIDFIECSARGSKEAVDLADMEGLEQWLAKIA